ncbi:MAG: hypothetical protein K0R31_1609 [Clostridiales bacterium]|nr:hypothetical protein [Clostridiales bacterium]
MVGQILGNRYELLEKIGGGGMAIVYKARCRLLNRFVAIKILRSEYTGDEEFVKRFLVEAQSAASLSHPNIVSIYDVGHDENIHYIVMEYINGITLKEYITKNRSLHWRDSVNIAIQICSAIEHAHRNHIIHRDIKPHNILLTNEGVAKVTDFGIARAASSSTITMVGSTIGSVHYFSPEQARGGYVDEKSDLYSLGIALYEMVTGRLPFDGETPVGVALKHLQVEAEEPMNLDSSIPKGVNDIIKKAMKKDQNKRYQMAAVMLKDLYAVLKDPSGSFITEEHVGFEESPTRRVKAIRDEDLMIGANAIDKEEEGEKKVKKSDRLTVGLAVAISLIIIAVFAFFTYKIIEQPNQTQAEASENELIVKNYVGRNINDVKTEIEKYSITVNEIRKPDEKTNKDIILSQRVEAGKKLKKGSSIDFEVSEGPNLITITDLRKTEARMAESTLKDLGLLTRIEEVYNDTIASGLVVKTDPAEKQQVKAGTVVTIFKSMGPELKEVNVPNLVGLTKDEAMKAIANANLKVGKIVPENTSNVVGKVIKQEPQAQTKVKEDTPINVYFEASTQITTQRRIMTERVNLTNSQSYPERFRVRVEIIPSDTNRLEVIMDEIKSKGDFPLTLLIPIPDNGSSRVRMFLNNSSTPYVEFSKP